jgi:hypothetical protein
MAPLLHRTGAGRWPICCDAVSSWNAPSVVEVPQPGSSAVDSCCWWAAWEVADTAMPSLRHSPTIRRYPQRRFPGQPQHELHHILGQAATVTPSRPRVRPVLKDRVPMPAQQRRRRDQKDRPTLPRHQLGQDGEDEPVGGGVAGPGYLPAQHHQLVAQHRDLHVLRIQSRTSPTRPRTRRTTKNPSVRTTTATILPARHPA